MANRTTRKAAQPKPAHECCTHIAGIFGLSPGPNGQPQIVGKTALCCHCGKASVEYLGIVEAGHGPFVTFTLPPPIVQARSPIILPANGAHC
jgi:hypothetical protein